MVKDKDCLNDHYINHLIELVSATSITVTSDVWSTERVCLLSAGTVLDEVELKKLVGRNLLQPLAHNLEIEGSFNAEQLRHALESYCANDTAIAEIYRKIDVSRHVAFACKRIAQQPSLLQYLWVMSRHMLKGFNRALFCAWAAAVLSKRKSKSDEQICDAFIAGLSHDIGLLFIPPVATADNQELNPEAWDLIQRHPEIGYDLLSFMPSMPNPVSRAVMEHHEEMDGSGYPAGKVGKQLGPLGRLIHLLDSVHAIYTKYFQPRGRTLADMIPIIQMNQLSSPGQPGADLIVLLRMGIETTSCSVPEELMPLFIKQVKNRHLYIKQFVDQAEIYVEQNQASIANARLFSLGRLLEHIVKAMNQSGLINEAYIRWLEQVEKEQLCHAYREVEDVFLMMQEVLYHIQRFVLRMVDLLESGENQVTQLTPIWAPEKSISLIETQQVAGSRESTRVSLQTFSKQGIPELPGELDSLWLTQIRKLRNI